MAAARRRIRGRAQEAWEKAWEKEGTGRPTKRLFVPPLPIRTVTDLPLRTDPHQTVLASLMTPNSTGEEHIMRALLNL